MAEAGRDWRVSDETTTGAGWRCSGGVSMLYRSASELLVGHMVPPLAAVSAPVRVRRRLSVPSAYDVVVHAVRRVREAHSGVGPGELGV